MSDDRSEVASPTPTVIGYAVHDLSRSDRLGTVYAARQLLHRREVALRVVAPAALAGGRDLTALCRAGRDACRVNHPHLLRLLEAGDSEGQFYLASDICGGTPLRQRLAGGPLAPAEAVRVVAAVASAVGRLHEEQVLHLAVSSEGVILEGATPYLTDVGLAEVLQPHGSAPFPGDPARAAPEQLARKKADERTDVYLLGALLYECLTGRPPAAAGSDEESAQLVASGRWPKPHAINPACPAALEHICCKALALRPAARHAGAAELVADLEHYQRGEAVSAAARTRFSWSRPRPATLALAAALALSLLGGAGLSVYLAKEVRRSRDEAVRERERAEQAAQEARRQRQQHDEARAGWITGLRDAEAEKQAARIERDEKRQQAFAEEKLRKRAEQVAREQAQLRAAAEERAGEAEAARKLAAAARDDALTRLDRLSVGQGVALMRTGDPTGALLPFVEALATARREKRPEEAHRLRIAGVLSQCPRPVCLLAFKKGDVTDAQLSRDGRRVLLVGADGVVSVRSALSGELVGKRMVNGAAVAAAAFSPDGLRVLTADSAARVRLWNVEDASDVFDPLSLDAVPLHLAFSGDGRRFAAVVPTPGDEPGGAVHVRDAGTGEAVGEAVAAQVAPRAAALSPDGTRLLVCCTDRSARQFDPKTGKQVGPALAHADAVLSAAYSADGRRALTSAADGTARVWDAQTGKAVSAPLGHADAGPLPALDESGKRLLTVAKDQGVRVYDVPAGKPVGPPLHSRSVLRQAVLSGDGRLALLAGADGSVRVFDLRRGEPLLPTLYHGAPLQRLAVSPDGARALCHDGRVLRVWDLTAGEPLAPAGPPAEEGVVYSDDAARRARIAGDTVQLEDPATLKRVGAAIKHKGPVGRVVFSPAGDRLLTVSQPADATVGTPSWDVRVFDAKTGAAVSGVMEHLREVPQVSFAAGGTRVLTVSMDKRVRLFDAKTGKRVGEPMEHADDVARAVVSPDGRYVATTDEGGMTRVWDAATGKRVGEGMGHAAAVLFVTFSPDGKTLATCCQDGTARVWEAATGKRLLEAEHAGPVVHASFDPAGKRLMTASADGTARVWDVATGKPHTPPMPHGGPVQATAFSDDGRWLLTAAGRFVRVHDGDGNPVSPPLPHSRHDVTVRSVSLSKAGELMSQAGPGTRWARPLTPDKRPPAELAELARVLSGREAAGPGQFAPVGGNELVAAWERLRARSAAEFDTPRDRVLGWARRGAAECEAEGAWAGAARHLNVLVEEAPGPALLARRGKARLVLGQYEDALSDYAKALEKEPGRGEWWAGRGETEAALGQWERAADSLTRAAKLEERNAGVWQRLGGVEAQRGRWGPSAEALGKAVRLGAPVWRDYALVQLSAGDEKGYRATCDRLVKRLRGRADSAAVRLAADVCALGFKDAAALKPYIPAAEQLAREFPDADTQVALAAFLLRAGEARRAAGVLEKAVAGDQTRPAWLWLLVLAHHKAGQAEKAKAAQEKAAKATLQETASWQDRQAVALLRKEAAGNKVTR
jgi:WD40 repeat protein/tetratricopeptide (TPR) repeat protein